MLFRGTGLSNPIVLSYFKYGPTPEYGPTPADPTDHWYEFMYDGQTGAQISGNVVTLYFVNGLRGDHDTTANGTVVEPGGPAIVNVAPTVDVGLDKSANEGETVNLTATFTDPNPGDTHTATIDWGDGIVEPCVVDELAGEVYGVHVYADNNTYIVSVTVTDNNGAAGSDTLTVTVNNVAPTVNAGSDQAVNEGSVVSLDPATFNDPGTADTHTATINWGDTTSDSGVVSETPFGPPGSVSGADGTVASSHVYADDGSYTVTVTVTDDEGDWTSGTFVVIVSNVAPELSGLSATAIDENQSTILTGTITDPGTLDTFMLLVDWGDGSPVESFSYPAGTTSFSETHQYLDDDPTGTPSDVYTISLTLTDDDTGQDTASTTLTVANVSPAVDAGPDQAVDEGQTVNFSGSFTDPGSADTHTIEWSFGDASTASGTLTPSHVYADNGTYLVTLTVTDDDGGVGVDTLTVEVANV